MKKKRPFEIQLTQLSLASSVPILLLLLWVMIYAEISIWLILLTALFASISIIYTHFRIHQKSSYQFRSLSNLLDAMMKGDYTMRARFDHDTENSSCNSSGNSSALDELVGAINGLAQRLSDQQLKSVESQLLLSTVIDHIDVAILALSENNEISFINPAAKKLLFLDEFMSTKASAASKASKKLLEQLSFVQIFSSGHHQVVELLLGQQQGRFNVHVEEFRESGLQHKLLFITDVRTLLRSEERKAWQSLLRVISHEINNSLSPITSISQTLGKLVERKNSNNSEVNDSEDLLNGLTIISERAKGLSQFISSYGQIAKLPEPKQQHISITQMIEKLCTLFEKQLIVVETENDVMLFIDPIQFEQVLINLVKNAIEAMEKSCSDGAIHISWQVTESMFRFSLYDQGSGISNPDNLFIPFYSTKKQGSGIGLVLCRQIVEAHNGYLSLTNRIDQQGCVVTIELPI